MTDQFAQLPRVPSMGPAPPMRPGPGTDSEGAAVDRAAERFEAAFISEMLRQSGFGEAIGKMSGGSSGAAFSQIMVDAVAEDIARTRPVGIAQVVAEALRARGGA